MNIERIKVLLVEDNPGDARLIREMLAEITDPVLEVECAEYLGGALERVDEGGLDAVLLDLSLPDSQGLETLVGMRTRGAIVPTVVLTGLDDEALGSQAIQCGAQDYLVKENVNAGVLVRVLRYAIERHRLQEELRSLSLVDDLTKLYNRRGFMTLSEQQLRLARRTKKAFSVLFADVDGLKQINDTFGHNEGNLVLIETARILKSTFRASDIVARVGGDEFAILTPETSKSSAEALVARLTEKLRTHDVAGRCQSSLSLSVGVAHWSPENPSSISELLARADASMYRHKRSNHGS